MKQEIKSLLELQKLDLVIQDLNNKINAIPQQIKEFESQKNSINTELENVKKIIADKKIERKNFDMELADAETKIKKHQTELNAVKSNDAYKALVKEIEDGKKRKDEVETLILGNMENIDKLNNDLNVLNSKSIEMQKQAKEKIDQMNNEINNLKSDLEKEQNTRNEIASSVPASLLKTYDKIRQHRGGKGIAEIKSNICYGCHLSLAPQIINEVLQDKEIVFCENCGRILYVNDSNLDSVRKG
jgi:uncharacterized protein